MENLLVARWYTLYPFFFVVECPTKKHSRACKLSFPQCWAWIWTKDTQPNTSKREFAKSMKFRIKNSEKTTIGLFWPRTLEGSWFGKWAVAKTASPQFDLGIFFETMRPKWFLMGVNFFVEQDHFAMGYLCKRICDECPLFEEWR